MTAMLEALSPLLKKGRAIKKGRKATTKPIFVSKKIEIDYTRELLAISQLCQEEAASLVIPEVAKNVGDAWFGEAIKKLKDKLSSIVNGISEKLAQNTVNAQRRESDKQLAQQLEKMTGIDLRNLFKDEDLTQIVEEAIAANVALIESIPSQYADKLQAAILKGLQEGQRASVIAEEIKQIGNITDSRAKLIATDQLGKINSRITQVRQEKLGITHYTWSTSRDERVRHEHRLRDGKLFAWDKPPKDGHAGQAIRCRCVALPYLDHLIDDDAPTPEQVMKGQESEIKNTNLASEHVKSSEQLLNSKSASGGLKPSDLLSINNGIGQGNKALRESVSLYTKLNKKLGKVPPAWAINHYSIHSIHINSLLRGANVNDEFKGAASSAVSLLDELFAKNKAIVQKPFDVFRGDALSDDELDKISQALRSGLPVTLKDKAFQSTTLNTELANMFAERNAKNNRKKVVFRLKLQQGVKAIDISQYHFYTGDNEVLLNRGSEWRITGMKQRKDGTYEIDADVLADTKSNATGDSKPAEKIIIEHDGGRDEDPYWDRWCSNFTIIIG